MQRTENMGFPQQIEGTVCWRIQIGSIFLPRDPGGLILNLRGQAIIRFPFLLSTPSITPRPYIPIEI